jgi:hypothetical protein
MASSWEHPELGRFKYDGIGWVRVIEVPAFRAFTYDAGRRKGNCELVFDADDEKDVPSAAAIAVARRVLSEQEKLAPKIVKALWDDFYGRGPESGMWWHGSLDEVTGAMEDADSPAPASLNDLLALLGPPQIGIHKRVYGIDKPVAELSFSAAFEEEHGVGVLTDGRSILGTGYSADVTPFKSIPRRSRPTRHK